LAGVKVVSLAEMKAALSAAHLVARMDGQLAETMAARSAVSWALRWVDRRAGRMDCSKVVR
jgi:hypothetical protein